MTDFDCHTQRMARKHLRCDYCKGWISPGTSYTKRSGKWGGEFFSALAHQDCFAMWNDAYSVYGDPYDGMPFDLYEAICGDEGREQQIAELNHWRGNYPHVVCRIELRMQISDQREIERQRAAGFEPELSPWEILHA